MQNRRGRIAHGKVIAMDAAIKMEPAAMELRLAELDEKFKQVGLEEAEHNEWLALRAVRNHHNGRLDTPGLSAL